MANKGSLGKVAVQGTQNFTMSSAITTFFVLHIYFFLSFGNFITLNEKTVTK